MEGRGVNLPASDSKVLPSGVIRTEVISPSDPKPCATISDWTSPSSRDGLVNNGPGKRNTIAYSSSKP